MTRIGAGHIFIRLFQFQNDVVTAVAVRFDVADIIFLFDDADAIEAFQEVDSPIDVVEETTDDTDADGIADIVESRIGRLRQALAVTFFPHTPFGLDAVNQVFISRFPGLGLYIVTIGADTADNIFQSSLQSRSIGTIDRIHSSITSFYKLSGMYEYYSTQKALSHEDSAFLL